MSTPCAIATIGNFDGVHLGHQKLVRTTVAEAREKGCKSRVFTFDPHPAQLFSRQSYIPLCSREERRKRLLALGADEVTVIPFTRELAAENAESFCRSLAHDYAIQKLVIGYDFRLGCDHAAYDTIKEIGREYGFSVEALQAVTLPKTGQIVSSTAIRKALADGNISLATAMLGRPYTLYGEILHGDGRGGPLLGFPTANLRVGETVVPPNGVYATSCRIFDTEENLLQNIPDFDGRVLAGVTNIGTLPTFKNGSRRTIETHLLDFSADLYGKFLEITFLSTIRQEIRFRSAEELKAQITADAQCRRNMTRSAKAPQSASFAPCTEYTSAAPTGTESPSIELPSIELPGMELH